MNCQWALRQTCHARLTNLPVLMIDHNVMRLNISMHNTLAVAEVQSLEELKDVEPDIDVIELGVEASEIGIVDVLENEGRRLTLFWSVTYCDVS